MPKKNTKITKTESEMDFGEITEALLKVIARDDSLQEQFATAIGVNLDTFQDYLDRVQFPVVGSKNHLEI